MAKKWGAFDIITAEFNFELYPQEYWEGIDGETGGFSR